MNTLSIRDIVRAYIVSRHGRENSDAILAQFADIEMRRITDISFDFAEGFVFIDMDDSQFGMTRIRAFDRTMIEWDQFDWELDEIAITAIRQDDIDIALAIKA